MDFLDPYDLVCADRRCAKRVHMEPVMYRGLYGKEPPEVAQTPKKKRVRQSKLTVEVGSKLRERFTRKAKRAGYEQKQAVIILLSAVSAGVIDLYRLEEALSIKQKGGAL